MADKEEEEARAQSVLEAIPHMSKEIVDDTLYEKVFSFLDNVIQKIPTGKLASWSVLSILTQACQEPGQDYRVHKLCYRLLGSLIFNRKTSFQAVISTSTSLLEHIVTGLSSDEAAVRYASVNAIRSFLVSPEAIKYLANEEAVAEGIRRAFTDNSLFVVSEACNVFRSVIEEVAAAPSDPHLSDLMKLYQNLNPSGTLKAILEQGGKNPRSLLSALEFLWCLVDTPREAVLEYLYQEQLLTALLPLLSVTTRVASLRILEVQTRLYEWAPNPLALLLVDPPIADPLEDRVKEAYDYLMAQASSMLASPERSSDLLTAVNIIQSAITLLSRYASHDSVEVTRVQQDLIQVLRICMDPTLIPQGDKLAAFLNATPHSLTLRSSIIQVILRMARTILRRFPELSNNELLDVVVQLLESKTFPSDQRVLRFALDLILSLFHRFALGGHAAAEARISQAIQRLLRMLHETDMDSMGITLVLNAFLEIFEHDTLGELMMEQTIAGSLIMELEIKLMDERWDVRDSVIVFIGALFQPPRSEFKMGFAIKYKLPFLVLDRINDRESYVRASALDVLQNFMKSKDGWYFIQQHQRTREVAAKLPRLLYDSEALVRRAALDAICCLVINRSCEGMAIEPTALSSMDDDVSLNPDIVAKLMDDPDSDVTMRMCQVLFAFWQLHHHVREQQKKARPVSEVGPSTAATAATTNHTEASVPIFYMLHGDRWLIEATSSTMRRVRVQAYDIIQQILQLQQRDQQWKGEQKKRSLDVDDDDVMASKDAAFIDQLQDLDFDSLRETLDPEHIFQEALDINADMMTLSLAPGHPDDDRNILDCYN